MPKAFMCYLPDELHEDLAVMAFETGLTKVEIIRVALAEKLDPKKKPIPFKKKRRIRQKAG